MAALELLGSLYVIQWGRVQKGEDAPGNATVSVTFPTKFKDSASVSVTVTPFWEGGGGQQVTNIETVHQLNNDGFKVASLNFSAPGKPYWINWIAVGLKP